MVTDIRNNSVYYTVYGTTLEADIKGDTSGPFQRLLIMAIEVYIIKLWLSIVTSFLHK